MQGVLRGHAQAGCNMGGRGVDGKKGLALLAVSVHARLVNGVDFAGEGLGQHIQGGAGAAQHLFAKSHQASQLAAVDALQGAAVTIRVQHQFELFRVGRVKLHTQWGEIPTSHDHFLTHGGAQAHADGAVVFKAGVEFGKLRHLQQNAVTLVQQFGRLFAHALRAAQLVVHPCQLLRQGVELVDARFHRFFGFGVSQIQLGRQLTKARSDAVGIAQKAAAQHAGGRVGRQGAGRGKKLVQCARQAQGLSAHDVDHPVGVVHHRFLAEQVAVAVAQVRLDKAVVLAFDAVKKDAGADIGGAHGAGGAGLHADVLA